jgi:hypothetical protein
VSKKTNRLSRRRILINALGGALIAFVVVGGLGYIAIAIAPGSIRHHMHILSGVLLVGGSVGSAVLVGYGAWRIEVEKDRRRRGCCPRCGYDLRESIERCSECGRRFKMSV